MKIKITNKSTNILPAYITKASAGMDLRADKTFIDIKPLERVLVPTGLFIKLPIGYEAQIRPISELAIEKGLTVLNTPGTIDADCKGEIKVIIVNISNKNQTIFAGNRIAQMIINKHERAELIQIR